MSSEVEQPFRIVREIGIDAGHRIPYHDSKCRNIHGHRYRVHACCQGQLQPSGSQQDMVLDFSFLKEEMHAVIDADCDHGLILSIDDPMLEALAETGGVDDSLDLLKSRVAEGGHTLTRWLGGKLYLMRGISTAESLARHWFTRLAPRVTRRTNGLAHLHQLVVWETPSCRAEYPAIS